MAQWRGEARAKPDSDAPRAFVPSLTEAAAVVMGAIMMMRRDRTRRAARHKA